jgi:type IV secretory pathway TraG/TraD family ATPase VirD4
MGLKDREMDLIERMKEVRVGEMNEEIRKQHAEKLMKCSESKKIVDCFSYTELLDLINELYENIAPESRLRILKRHAEFTSNNPAGWSIFNELASPVDIDAFCASLIPESASQDNFWPISSRQLLGSIITFCIHHGKTGYDDLWAMVNKSNEELLNLFKNTPGCEEGMKLLTEAKTANNILAVLSNYTKPIKYLRGTDGDFSIKKWIREADLEKRVIFLSNYAMIQETIKPFLTLFVDFSTKTLCSLDDDLNRRLFFILDEFGQLSKIGSIIQLLTQSRSKGGASFILIQDVAQITSIYGKDGSTSIVNSCGNTISFAVSDESTADFISKKIGSMEIKRSEESKSMGVDDLRDSISISRQTTEKRVVMPSEIMNVPTMNCFIQLTDCPVTRDNLEYMKFPKRGESYIGREDLLLSRMSSSSTGKGEGSVEQQEVADEFFESTKQAVEELMDKKEPGEEYYGTLEPAVMDTPNKADIPASNNEDNRDFF